MKRARLFALAVSSTVALACAGAMAWSALYNGVLLGQSHTRALVVDRGCVYLQVCRSTGPLLYGSSATGVVIHLNSLYDLGHGRRWPLSPRIVSDPTVLVVRVPIWIPTACATAGVAWLWKPWRSRWRAG